MQLAVYKKQDKSKHKRDGNPHVKCNALYKKQDNFNCLLTPSQAIELSQALLAKAQILMDNGITDGAVHLWNQGEDNEKLYVGLHTARKGPRRKKGKAGTTPEESFE